MKTTEKLLCLALLVSATLTPNSTLAQSTKTLSTPRSESDQLLRDILNEIRELRHELQRVTTAAHRAQVVLERVRLQQEQVVQLTRDLSDIRDAVGEVRHRQIRTKDRIEELEKRKSAGLVADTEVTAVRNELAEMVQREQILVERESQYNAQLDAARASLLELYRQLDDLEREMTPSDDNKTQPARKP